MSTERFSKKSFAKYVFSRIDYLEKTYGFDPGNGWAQVKDKNTSLIVAYGEYYTLKQQASEFELYQLRG